MPIKNQMKFTKLPHDADLHAEVDILRRRVDILFSDNNPESQLARARQDIAIALRQIGILSDRIETLEQPKPIAAPFTDEDEGKN
jgi:hypothetical protein